MSCALVFLAGYAVAMASLIVFFRAGRGEASDE